MSRTSRLLDVFSLGFVVFGGSCYAWAYSGMHALQRTVHDPNAPIFAGYTRYVRLMQLSWLGIAGIGLGVAVGVYAALHARRPVTQTSD